MGIIRQDSGCKVGWVTYDNEAEALERSAKERVAAVDAAARGYDFGWETPGRIEHDANHLPETWRVTTV